MKSYEYATLQYLEGSDTEASPPPPQEPPSFGQDQKLGQISAALLEFQWFELAYDRLFFFLLLVFAYFSFCPWMWSFASVHVSVDFLQ